MRKLLNNRWFVAAMATTAIVLAWSSLEPATAPGIAVGGNLDPMAETSVMDEASSSPQETLPELPLAKNVRDPFAIFAMTETSEIAEKPEQDFVDTAHLSGIWTQNGATFVLVNEQIRSIGDSIGRLTIESASQEGVWLTHRNGRSFLALGKTFVLKTPGRPTAQNLIP